MIPGIFLAAANLVSLAGVVFWGWDAFELLVLYWLETAIIAFWTVVQIALRPGAGDVRARSVPAALGRALFFALHAAIFMAVHMLILWRLFGGLWAVRIHGPGDFVRLLILDNGLWIPLAFLFVVRGGMMLGQMFGLSALDGERGALRDLYARIITLHLTLLIGAFAADLLGGRYAPIILIAIKTAIDLFFDPFRAAKEKSAGVSKGSLPP